MHTSFFLSFLASTTLLASASPTQSDADRCRINKSPAIVNAIDKFCKKTDMVTPSPYAGGGATSDDNTYQVMIHGTCTPHPQWVPQKYCYSQFYDMCANGDVNGERTSYYGTDNCQRWRILKLVD